MCLQIMFHKDVPSCCVRTHTVHTNSNLLDEAIHYTFVCGRTRGQLAYSASRPELIYALIRNVDKCWLSITTTTLIDPVLLEQCHAVLLELPHVVHLQSVAAEGLYPVHQLRVDRVY